MVFETYKGVVYPQQCDLFGHMNIQFYMAKYDEAAWNFFSQLGFDTHFFHVQRKGLAALEHHIRYFKELKAGEALYIESTLLKMERKTITFEKKMYRQVDQLICSQLIATAALMDLESRSAIPFSEDEKALLLPFLPAGS